MQRRKCNGLALIAATAAALLAGAAYARELVVVGTAYAGDRMLYREYHYRDGGDGRAQVIYRNDSGREIADKVLEFDRSGSAPSFRQRDLRSGEILAAQWRDDELQLLRRDGPDRPAKTRRVDPSGHLVVDAGFDNFIRNHFRQLLAGETLRFEFALPARLTTVVLQVGRHQCASGDNAGRVCFRVAAHNWMVRMLASPIDLEYDRASRRLLTFRGISNITTADGAGQHVVIRYRYLPATAGAGAMM